MEAVLKVTDKNESKKEQETHPIMIMGISYCKEKYTEVYSGARDKLKWIS